MSNLIPVPMDRVELPGLLRLMAQLIEDGDSFEGNIEYLMPDPEDPPADFMVRGVFRTGNSMGQGGTTMIGRVPE